MELERHPFPVEEIREAIREVVSSTLPAGTVFATSRVDSWTASITDGIIKKLVTLNKPYKYIVSCTLVQHVGAGLHTASLCLWDKTTDGSVTEQWANETIQCVVTVYGLGI